MIRIFLVEDEFIALQALEFKIRELGDPYEIAGTAVNGIDALSQLKQTKADIVIADINMPEMDGLELIEHLSEEHPEIITVILSGYQEFDYAQKALRFGTQDYLLKPVSVDDLQSCLDRCASKLLEKQKNKNVIMFLLDRDTCTFPADPTGSEFGVAYMIIANMISTASHIIHPGVPYIESSKIESHLASLLPDGIKFYCFDGIFSNEKALVLSGTHLDEKRLQQLLLQVIQGMEQLCQNYVTAYYEHLADPSGISGAILRCRSEAAKHIILGRTQLCSSPAADFRAWPDLQKQADLFLMLLKQRQTDLLRSNIVRLFDQWAQVPRTALEIQKDMIFILEHFNHNLPEELPLGSTFLTENMLCFYSGQKDLAEDFYQLLVRFPNPDYNASLSSEELVEKLDHYLQSSLSQSLSLQMLSDEFGVSKVYLCRIFKKYKNMTPIDYFNRLKIDRAAQMLTQFPKMPLREIASALGFNDIYYFSKVFKRIAGVSPSELRSRN